MPSINPNQSAEPRREMMNNKALLKKTNDYLEMLSALRAVHDMTFDANVRRYVSEVLQKIGAA
jgi:hypothetical protein